jgi:hypothetical protein
MIKLIDSPKKFAEIKEGNIKDYLLTNDDEY